MWLIVGHRKKLEPVPDGESRLIDCTNCNTPRKHAPFKVVQSATAFFVSMANISVQHVYVCNVCGQRIERSKGTEDDWTDHQQGSVAGHLMSAIGMGANAVQQGVKRGTELARDIDQDAAAANLKSAFEQGSETFWDGVERSQRMAEDLVEQAAAAADPDSKPVREAAPAVEVDPEDPPKPTPTPAKPRKRRL